MHFLPGIVLTAAVATITLVTVRRIKEENQQPTEEITE
jgi:hypothetical protein